MGFAEHFFCVYFSFEWLARFMAFARKRDCLKDAWFVFDSALVSTMVLETWVLMVIMLAINSDGSGSLGNPGFLRLFRLMRLSRMFRMVRLLRAMPELMVMIKAMTVAMRSMLFALCLLMGIVYVFAIAFTQVMENTDPGDKYFKTVGDAMQALLLIGILCEVVSVVSS